MGRMEKLFMAIGFGIPLITGAYATASRMMNPMTVGFCFINANPPECTYWETGAVFDEYCETALTGENLLINQAAFANMWVLLIIFVIIYSMISLYLFVRKQERRGAFWIYNNQDRRLEKKVLAKAIMYISVHLLIWIPTALAVLGQTLIGGLDWSNAMLCVLLPFQGGFNALIYSGVLEKSLEKLFCCIGGTAPRGSRRASMEGVVPLSFISMGIGSSGEVSAKVDADAEIDNRDLNKFNAPNSLVLDLESKTSC